MQIIGKQVSTTLPLYIWNEINARGKASRGAISETIRKILVEWYNSLPEEDKAFAKGTNDAT